MRAPPCAERLNRHALGRNDIGGDSALWERIIAWVTGPGAGGSNTHDDQIKRMMRGSSDVVDAATATVSDAQNAAVALFAVAHRCSYPALRQVRKSPAYVVERHSENPEDIHQQHVYAPPGNESLVLPALSMDESHAEQVIIALRANIIADESLAMASVANEPPNDIQAHVNVLRAALGAVLKVGAHNERCVSCRLGSFASCNNMSRLTHGHFATRFRSDMWRRCLYCCGLQLTILVCS